MRSTGTDERRRTLRRAWRWARAFLGGALILACCAFTWREVASRTALRRAEALFAPHAGDEPSVVTPETVAGLGDLERFGESAFLVGPPFGQPFRASDDPVAARASMARLRKWAIAEQRRGAASIPPPPPEVLSALQDLSATSQLRAALLLGHGGGASPTRKLAPMTWAHLARSAADALSADALSAITSGDESRAAGDLEAVWRLATMLHQMDAAIPLIFGSYLRRAALLVVRKLERPDAIWISRCEAEPVRRAYVRAMQFGCRAVILDGRSRPSETGWHVGRLLEPLAVQELRQEAAAALPPRVAVMELLEEPARCGPGSWKVLRPDGSWPGDGESLHGPRSYGFLVPRLDVTRLDMEFTRRILELRAAEAAGRDATDAVESSCAGVRFVTRREPGGPLVLEAESLEGAWWEREGEGAVLRFELTPR